MENDVAQCEEVLSYSCNVKLHSSMCKELEKFVHRITRVFPAIEAARPGCKSGIQELCALNRSIERANLLLRHCAESSKLYLAISGEAIQLRFERVQKALDISLTKIQTMVQQPLAAQVSDIVSDLRDAKLIKESSEEEAGRLLIALLQQDGLATDPAETSELEVFQIAAQMLDITSSKALLIEKRSIKKLLDKVCDTDPRKQSILKYFLYLIRKHEKLIGSKRTENVNDQSKVCPTKTNSSGNNSLPENQLGHAELRLRMALGNGETNMKKDEPETTPEEFICPISSKLMSDPVVIASGQTYERICVEKWFSEGHNTCPKTLRQLPHLSMTPNSCLKDLISKWCRKHGITIPDPNSQPSVAADSSCNMSSSNSISSLSSSLNGMSILLNRSSAYYINESDTSNVSITSSNASNCLDSSHLANIESLKDSQVQVFLWSDDSGSCQSFAEFDHEMYLNFFYKLATLPKESQCKAVEDVKTFLTNNNDAYYSMHSNGFVEALMRFLLDAYIQSNINAQRTGLRILSAFISNCRSEIPSLEETAFDMLASFLDSELSEEALSILQNLSSHWCYKPKIMASIALPSIIKIIDSPDEEYLIQAVKILSDLSSDGGIESFILHSGCILKLVQLLGHNLLAGNCIKILRNLCRTEETRVAIAETDGSIASIAELLDTGSRDEQEHAAAILLSLCSYRPDYCHLVMNEGVIPALVNVSINGNITARESAMKLLHHLRDLRHDDPPCSPLTQVGSDSELSQDSSQFCRGKQSASNVSTFFKKKIKIFSKRRSLALF
ncbi:hypothetical protein AAC387_Pa05g2732 [Persea americana]